MRVVLRGRGGVCGCGTAGPPHAPKAVAFLWDAAIGGAGACSCGGTRAAPCQTSSVDPPPPRAREGLPQAAHATFDGRVAAVTSRQRSVQRPGVRCGSSTAKALEVVPVNRGRLA